jgi:beta-lactamase class A
VKKRYLFGGLAFAIFAVTGMFIVGYNRGEASLSYLQKEQTKQNSQIQQYNFLAKRLFLDEPNENRINFTPLREELKNYFANNNLNGGNLYFEYLPTGTSIRISGDEQLVAASLMKVPVAMEAYKAAELGKLNLDQVIALKPEWLNSEYGNLYKQGAGYKLTVREAIRIMLEDSDNTALFAVAETNANTLPAEQSSLNYMDLDYKVNPDQSIAINARSYSSVLKCLYFSCYNNKDDSQKILNSLVNSTYKNRLKAGISNQNIAVAHKIGTNLNLNQSDCGIIYYPRNNYLLCVMIPGPSTAETDKKISDISKIVFDYISQKQ